MTLLPIDEFEQRAEGAASLLAAGLFGRVPERDAMAGALQLLEQGLMFARMVKR